MYQLKVAMDAKREHRIIEEAYDLGIQFKTSSIGTGEFTCEDYRTLRKLERKYFVVEDSNIQWKYEREYVMSTHHNDVDHWVTDSPGENLNDNEAIGSVIRSINKNGDIIKSVHTNVSPDWDFFKDPNKFVKISRQPEEHETTMFTETVYRPASLAEIEQYPNDVFRVHPEKRLTIKEDFPKTVICVIYRD